MFVADLVEEPVGVGRGDRDIVEACAAENGGGPGNTVNVSSPAGVVTVWSIQVSRNVLGWPRITAHGRRRV